MSKEAYNKIKVKFQRLDTYLGYLKDLQKSSQESFVSDYHLHGLAERYLQVSTQIILDVSQMIIVAKGLRRPENNSEVFVILGETKIITKKLEERLMGISNFRNILVHDYEKIDLNKIYVNLKNNLKNFTDFKKQILKKLK